MTLLKIQIKHQFTDAVIFEHESVNNTIKETVEKANLVGANLYGANLVGANLDGAKHGELIIKKMGVWSGLYNYVVIAMITDEGKKYIRLGCYFRSLEEWESNFWNNPREFPNDNSEKSNLRLFAYETAKRWFEIVSK